MVPRAGVEPAQVALLVFETSASTDSAIWAASVRDNSEMRCKDRKFFRIDKGFRIFLQLFLKKKCKKRQKSANLVKTTRGRKKIKNYPYY